MEKVFSKKFVICSYSVRSLWPERMHIHTRRLLWDRVRRRRQRRRYRIALMHTHTHSHTAYNNGTRHTLTHSVAGRASGSRLYVRYLRVPDTFEYLITFVWKLFYFCVCVCVCIRVYVHISVRKSTPVQHEPVTQRVFSCLSGVYRKTICWCLMQ